MKRRKFIINSILVGVACILPLPKIKKKPYVFWGSQYMNEPLAPEVLEGAINYFERQPQMPIILDPKRAIRIGRLQKGVGDTYFCHIDLPLNLNKGHFTIFKK